MSVAPEPIIDRDPGDETDTVPPYEVYTALANPGSYVVLPVEVWNAAFLALIGLPYEQVHDLIPQVQHAYTLDEYLP